jgi:glycerol kinase
VSFLGITNQRETTVAWSRSTGQPLCRAIVWTDSRTKNTVAHYQHKLETHGLEVEPGVVKKGSDAVDELKKMSVHYPSLHFQAADALSPFSTGLPLSTYFSAIKLRWMLDNYPEVAAAHESDDLLFGTVESWLLYVSLWDSCTT